MDPQTQKQWMQVATTRLQEARVINAENGDSVGSAYLAGYGVECALKAYAADQGRKITGHDLINLTSLAGLSLSTFKYEAWFLTEWAVDWRYLQQASQLSHSPSKCIDAAGSLQGFIVKQLKRRENRRIRRGKQP